jgi:hypothetical protein
VLCRTCFQKQGKLIPQTEPGIQGGRTLS